ncbi:MAG: hypothetical protein ACI9W4_002481, partial [Rhodothermales bacterium]
SCVVSKGSGVRRNYNKSVACLGIAQFLVFPGLDSLGIVQIETGRDQTGAGFIFPT